MNQMLEYNIDRVKNFHQDFKQTPHGVLLTCVVLSL